MNIKKFIKLCRATADFLLFSLFNHRGLKWRL